MQKKIIKNKIEKIKNQSGKQNNTLDELVGKCIERLCLERVRQISEESEIEGRKDAVPELLKLVQLLDKYQALREKSMTSELQEQEAIKLNYALLKRYLDKQCHENI